MVFTAVRMHLRRVRAESAAVPAACALSALAVAAAGVLPPLAASGWQTSTLARLGATTRFGALAHAIDHGLRFTTKGYDGQFYWGVAVDPLARGHLPAVFDKASYRYGHPLYGWMAWLLSGGRPALVADALLALGLVSLALAAAGTALLARRHRRTPWFGLAVAADPGLLAAVRADLAEPLAAALMSWALFAHASRHWRATWVLLALLPLAKEPLLVVVVAVAAWELLQRRPRSAILVSTTLLPATTWWLYLRVHLGAFFTTGATALAPPFTGWLESFDHSLRLSTLAIVLLIGLLVVFAVACVGAARRRDALDLTYLALVTVVIALGGNATAAFMTALRNSALALMLAPLALASLKFRNLWPQEQ